jgi:hypothetical protein
VQWQWGEKFKRWTPMGDYPAIIAWTPFAPICWK